MSDTVSPPPHNILPWRKGGYSTLVADFPWPFDDRGSRATPGVGTKVPGYQFITEDEIRRFPIGELAAPRAHLYLWTTDSHLELALECIGLWGFQLKCQIIWAKTTNDGSKIRFGLGHYLRKAHEPCLFAVRGKLKVAAKNVPSVFLHPMTPHSQKPETLQDIAEKLSPGPRLELFARRRRPGWQCWGDQLESG